MKKARFNTASNRSASARAARDGRHWRNRRERLRCQNRGFTIIELMLIVGIVGILSSIAMTSYSKFVERAQFAQVLVDMGAIQRKIDIFLREFGDYPTTLDDVDGVINDPWGNPYQYLNFDSTGANGKRRKDKNLVPINTDYDLYSMGEDGSSQAPLTAKASRDDIVRANNGSYIGLASKY